MSGSGSWIVPIPVPVFRFSFAEGNVINFLTISSIAPDHSPKAKAPPVHQAIGLAVLSVGTLGNYNKFFLHMVEINYIHCNYCWVVHMVGAVPNMSLVVE